MKALSIRQPWLWAIMYAGKNIENRSWKPPYNLTSGWIALHASKRPENKIYAQGCYNLADKVPKDPPTTGAILAVAKIPYAYERSANHTSIWSVPGLYGWKIEDVRIFPTPIVCKGALRFWEIPKPIALEIDVQLKLLEVNSEHN